MRDLVNEEELPGVSQGKLQLFVDMVEQNKAEENPIEDIQVSGSFCLCLCLCLCASLSAHLNRRHELDALCPILYTLYPIPHNLYPVPCNITRNLTPKIEPGAGQILDDGDAHYYLEHARHGAQG